MVRDSKIPSEIPSWGVQDSDKLRAPRAIARHLIELKLLHNMHRFWDKQPESLSS